ncbi:NAD+ synthase [Litoribrevibacter albus]|uniref:Glutamine-dependent NAD(+) synthetase n=1 Tax=Litoribrevibacter albus TaxID=1473156 RepID=A0AA37W8A9_9GAMM|nr:NAD+ synthase [Litoribrevibacter albus]GLQ33670.1 NAD+ synthase [Litoribrevibacter albus]
MAKLSVVMAQVNPLVGDIEGNTQLVLDQVRLAQSEHDAELVLFPELVLTGYPPEDLLLRPSLDKRISQALERLKKELPQDVYVVLGLPLKEANKLYNSAVVLFAGAELARYHKQKLPNFQVFDEKRYFTEGHTKAVVLDIEGITFGITICEDVWHDSPVADAVDAGAQCILNLNASPFHQNKVTERHLLIEEHCRKHQISLLYVNQVGGQDELIFDGASMAVDAQGNRVVLAQQYQEMLVPLTLDAEHDRVVISGEVVDELSEHASVYQALVTGVRDYVNKNHFKGVVLGLSGGIDSALTLAVAVDAIGAERVEAVMMPYKYTSQMSLQDAEAEANALGVRYKVIPIEASFNAFMTMLEDEFEGTQRDTTEENLQARCRGVLLMAISNKKGYLVLTTGNKSEMAVGYSTLYGDMAGGFDVLKDVPKTLVFALSRYRNTVSEVIPDRVITRPPSAELAPDQKDEDSLPPYDVLDEILRLYVEEDVSADDIVVQGFSKEDVYRVVRLVDLNEYKRRQAPIGIRITQRGFGKDRRYPITSGWHIGE